MTYSGNSVPKIFFSSKKWVGAQDVISFKKKKILKKINLKNIKKYELAEFMFRRL
jgi:hypothetical protein